jgi:uncharacterized protein
MSSSSRRADACMSHALLLAVLLLNLHGLHATEPPAQADAAPVATQPAVEKPPAQKPRRANRLAKETSPYLLLHAHDPVEWYAWGEEALAKAKAENKLIFLSIGYSSCYWCHVMQRESFMDEEVAAYLNKHFIAIKIDREERPDIDEIYMTALQVLGRRGGWPLTMFLTPDGKPIVGGTYFPPRDKDVEVKAGAGRAAEKQHITGLLTLLEQVQTAWRDQSPQVREHAEQVTRGLRLAMQRDGLKPAALPEARWPAEVEAALAEEFDSQYGGFGFSASNPRQPKFPEPSNLVLLLDRARREKSEPARAMLVKTLTMMAEGGIRDHLGGGFHRYSTDRYWRIPHFEKMLYDNAQLASVYAEAYDLTHDATYRRVCEESLDFVLRELTDPAGGFYSALDAETAAREGRYYVWTREEIERSLGPEDAARFAAAYLAGDGPNFEGRYALQFARPLKELAAAAGVAVEDYPRQLLPLRQKLLAVRDKRDRPLTDTKILTSWNGLMIRGLADAGRILKAPRYTQAAAKAADFALATLRTPEGRLLRTYGKGQAKLNAYLDDYAFLVDGLIALHRATGEKRWLVSAGELTDKQIELFWDDQRGGFFFTSDDHEQLLARGKSPVDSALPSGNAVAAGNLAYLAGPLERPQYLERAERTIRCFSRLLEESPLAAPRMAVTLAALRAAQAK